MLEVGLTVPVDGDQLAPFWSGLTDMPALDISGEDDPRGAGKDFPVI